MGEIHFLYVGCADCTVIKSANKTVLVDCADGIRNYTDLLPSDKKIAAVFITHQNRDHFGGLSFLMHAGYKIDTLVCAPCCFLDDYVSGVTEEEWGDFYYYLFYFMDNGTQLCLPYRQQDFNEPYCEIDGMQFFILGPAEPITNRRIHIHDACLVILAVLGERKVVFTGDASIRNLNYIARNPHYRCDDILMASHHGSRNGVDETFVRWCNPIYTIISTGENPHNFPHPEAMMIYRQYTRKRIYRTDIHDSITVPW